jgi:hypothetical protein
MEQPGQVKDCSLGPSSVTAVVRQSVSQLGAGAMLSFSVNSRYKRPEFVWSDAGFCDCARLARGGSAPDCTLGSRRIAAEMTLRIASRSVLYAPKVSI